MKQIDMTMKLAMALLLVPALVAAAGAQSTNHQRGGVPALEAPAPQVEAVPSTKMRPVHFDFDAAKLRSHDEAALKESAVWIKANPGYKIVIAGFADARGTQTYNLALAQRRAQSVRAFLVEEGVRPERIEVVSYGVTDPRCTQQVEPCWARNRRVELFVKAAPPEAS